MISFSTKADKNGFWYLVNAPEGSTYALSYIVIGSGGRLSSGEITGLASNTGVWQFQNIGFPVLRVGLTDLHVEESAPTVSEVPKAPKQIESLSRRKAIKSFASAFLAGSAMLLFPSGSAAGQTLPGEISALEEPYETGGNYNPYGNGEAESFNPYK